NSGNLTNTLLPRASWTRGLIEASLIAPRFSYPAVEAKETAAEYLGKLKQEAEKYLAKCWDRGLPNPRRDREFPDRDESHVRYRFRLQEFFDRLSRRRWFFTLPDYPGTPETADRGESDELKVYQGRVLRTFKAFALGLIPAPTDKEDTTAYRARI